MMLYIGKDKKITVLEKINIIARLSDTRFFYQKSNNIYIVIYNNQRTIVF